MPSSPRDSRLPLFLRFCEEDFDLRRGTTHQLGERFRPLLQRQDGWQLPDTGFTLDEPFERLLAARSYRLDGVYFGDTVEDRGLNAHKAYGACPDDDGVLHGAISEPEPCGMDAVGERLGEGARARLHPIGGRVDVWRGRERVFGEATRGVDS